jgi:mannitol/fructose-specific phosphotransferase system IIA component
LHIQHGCILALTTLLVKARVDNQPEAEEARAAIQEAREEAARSGYVADEHLDRVLPRGRAYRD